MIGFYNKTLITTYCTLFSGVLGTLCAFSHHPRYAVVFLMISAIIDILGGYLFDDSGLSFKERHFGLIAKAFTHLIAFCILPAAIGFALGLNNLLAFVLLFVFIFANIIKLSYTTAMYTVRLTSKHPADYHIGLPMASAALIFPLAYALACFTGKLITVYIVFLVIATLAAMIKIKIPRALKTTRLLCAAIGILEFALVLYADI